MARVNASRRRDVIVKRYPSLVKAVDSACE